MRPLAALLSALVLVACGSAEPVDPCAGVSLPPCPPPCADGAFSQCGEACEAEGASCGNEIGDGLRCEGGAWQCTVHAPLGTGCNRICRAG